MTLTPEQILHAPPNFEKRLRGEIEFFFDPDTPNWLATTKEGAALLLFVDGKRKVSDLVGLYQSTTNKDWAEAWLDVHTMLKHAVRTDFLRTDPFQDAPYPGRGNLIEEHQHKEIWLHLTNRCNLTCSHCLVSSSPTGIHGLSTEKWIKVINDAKLLGVKQFYITGGEPFLRRDLWQIIEAICSDCELVLLTNAMLINHECLEKLRSAGNGNVSLQVSVDGADSEIHNAIRGSGFKQTVQGIQTLVEAGFEPTVSTVVTNSNINTLPQFPRFLEELGVRRHHLLWDHKKGRAMENELMQSPTPDEIIGMLELYLENSLSRSIELDNYEVALERIRNRRGVKVDLSVAATSSCCVYADGSVYPSAALVAIDELRMGNIHNQALSDIWEKSDPTTTLRHASVIDKEDCNQCYLRYICGGGDIEHSFFYSGEFLGKDPFSKVHEWLLMRAMEQTVIENGASFGRSGYDSPTILAAMGESLSEIDTVEVKGFEIATSRSTCVLSVDLEKSREKVREFYAHAATEPQEALCCPTAYDGNELAALPKEVVEVAYGCGSPLRFADLKPGETYVDLGSGGGIDCFIAAKKIGSKGRVIGIDMTPEMIERANRNRHIVSNSIGYDTIEFRHGYLEQVPLEDRAADIVTSNCVINLSPDKRRVFSQMWRILKNHGRVVISDTVTESEIPHKMKANPRLWGECVSGALTQDEYFAMLEQIGFYGLSLLEKTFWKEIDGYRFHSVIIRGFKLEKSTECNFLGQQAMYLGPLKAVIDEEGHLFPRNELVEVCTDTAAKLSNLPYAETFLVIQDGEDNELSSSCCEPSECC